jgi:hypothetical protein
LFAGTGGFSLGLFRTQQHQHDRMSRFVQDETGYSIWLDERLL